MIAISTNHMLQPSPIQKLVVSSHSGLYMSVNSETVLHHQHSSCGHTFNSASRRLSNLFVTAQSHYISHLLIFKKCFSCTFQQPRAICISLWKASNWALLFSTLHTALPVPLKHKFRRIQVIKFHIYPPRSFWSLHLFSHFARRTATMLFKGLALLNTDPQVKDRKDLRVYHIS